jgi:hypothetical protein
VNTKAKQRAWSRGPEPDKAKLQDIPVDATPLAPLTAPEGRQVFDVGVENAGERLDRFLGQGAAARRIARQSTKTLRAILRRACPRARASSSRRRRPRNRPLPAKTSS